MKTASLLIGLALAMAAAGAAAHKSSDAYLQLQVQGTRIDQRIDIALRDLDRELTLDANGDDVLTWGEVRTRWAEIEALADAGLQLQAEGSRCRPGPGARPQLDEHSDGRYAVLERTWTCDAPVHALSLDYRLFAASDPTHRGILRATQEGLALTAALVPGAAARRLFPGGSDAPQSPVHGGLDFLAEGVHHILIGTDHILFLLALLLPAVLVRRGRPPRGAAGPAPGAIAQGASATLALRALPIAALLPWRLGAAPAAAVPWQAAPAFGPALREVLKVVTAFTVAHSVTLALAVLGVVNPPSRWIESLIAASVVLAAINNLVPVADTGRWRFTFGFGLVHGFGFAGALKDLGLADAGLAGPLFAFNLGVELGQIALVLLFVPLAWALRERGFYTRWVLRGGSVLIAAVALVWLVERAFDLALLPSLGV